MTSLPPLTPEARTRITMVAAVDKEIARRIAQFQELRSELARVQQRGKKVVESLELVKNQISSLRAKRARLASSQ